jgi:hypothetical protein
MTKNKPGSSNRFMVPRLLFLCFVLILPAALGAQTTLSTAVVMVEIQCKPGMAEQYREALEKQIFPAIREAIQKGDVFTNFTYLEAPVPAQDIDFVLIFEAKSFGSLDTRRIPPHYDVLLHRLGPEAFAALMKEMGNCEKTVRVSILRSYKVQ